MPFGLVELCPDTWPGSLTGHGDLAHSGYDFSDNHIRGFSHLHRGSSGGTTVHDRSGLISVIPLSGSHDDGFFRNPVLRMDKSTEKAEPGWYSVFLDEEKIHAELTATTRTGFHRYVFDSPDGNKVFIYEGNRGGAAGISCRQISSHALEGSVGNKYFTIVFDHPIAGTRIWNGSESGEGNSLSGVDDGGIICEFDNLRGNTLQVKAGVSLSSVESASANLRYESDHWNFGKVRKRAGKEWNKVLSGIIATGDREDLTIFYTALYHACFLPVNQTDAEGVYPGLDEKLHKADGYIHYDGFAFWDSFRTKYPLYSLFIPGIYSDIVTSLRDLYQQADNWSNLPGSDHPPHGVIYKAAGKNGYQIFASCRHEHMLMVVADAWFKGLMKTDINEVYPFMMREVMLQMPEKYDSIGYIPARPDQTGEYSWDNWVLAQVARVTGREEDYGYLMKRSEYWRNTWDPEIRYFRARAADGTWLDFPEDPAINREKYTYEGSKWHWRWNVVHDIPSLTELFGGKEEFLKELEYFFDNDLYTAGNQIDLHAPFLFNMAGAPWLTQKWSRKILTEPIVQKYGTHGFFKEPIYDRVYKSTPDGYLREMDCDYGCMAAWYAMSAMGLYQVCPGDPVYQLSSPVFNKVIINPGKDLSNGGKFVIKAMNQGRKNCYIQSATLNGRPLNRSWITHDEIAAGGRLVFELGDKPNMEWGRQ